jgi:hypothetical protein
MSDEPDLRCGDTVKLDVEAKVIGKYQSGRVKLRWESGEETVHPTDSRVNNG